MRDQKFETFSNGGAPLLTKKGASQSQQNSPSFYPKKVIDSKPRVISDRMIDKSISKNIRANLKPAKKAQPPTSPQLAHKYSKTFSHIDEIPGVFTFINNHVSVDLSNKERSLSPHSRTLNSAKSRLTRPEQQVQQRRQ